MASAKRVCGPLDDLERRLDKKRIGLVHELEECKISIQDLETAQSKLAITKLRIEKAYTPCFLAMEVVRGLREGPVFIPDTRWETDFNDICTHEDFGLTFDVKLECQDSTVVIFRDNWKTIIEDLIAADCPANTALICRQEDLKYAERANDDDDDNKSEWQKMSLAFTLMVPK